MNKTVGLILLVVLVVGVVIFFVSNQQKPQEQSAMVKTEKPSSQTISQASMSFTNPKKAAHYESNTPEHGSTLAGVPINVVIDFNFDLAKPSEIKLELNDKDYGVGETIIDPNSLALRRNMDPNAPNGIYTVLYKACWADGSCHDGQFQFKVDRNQASSFTDMRNKKEVTVNLKNTAFTPQNLRVSVGTKVTWINEDNTVHTVNTDSHPAHTYYPHGNSRNLNKGDQYFITFDKPGIYPYHCTPHASTMKGSVLVE